jgi:hypothetical protein
MHTSRDRAEVKHCTTLQKQDTFKSLDRPSANAGTMSNEFALHFDDCHGDVMNKKWQFSAE